MQCTVCDKWFISLSHTYTRIYTHMHTHTIPARICYFIYSASQHSLEALRTRFCDVAVGGMKLEQT